MQVLRTIIWILLICGILIFSFYNWRPVEVTIWENIVLETKVPMLVIAALVIGFVPVFAYHLSVKWSLKRRIRTLEASLKTLATTHRNNSQGSPATEPAATPLSPEGTAQNGPANPSGDAPSPTSGGGIA